jgi:molybdate transport system substrate-binding protein
MRYTLYRGVAPVIAILLLFIPAAPVRAAELLLLAGAGLRQPVELLAARFEKDTGHRVIAGYDGGGKLLARIKASGRGDVFMPGALFYIERLQRDGLIRCVRPVAAHTAVVGVSQDAVGRIRTFEDLAKPGVRLALGDPEAMAFGRTALTMIRRSGLEKEILENVAVYGATVKQLALYVARGDVDASIIGRADAFQMKDRIKMIPIPKDYFEPETVAAAVLESTRAPEAAECLCDFLASERALEVFCEFGFLPLED